MNRDRNEMVGSQSFTYGELEDAWERLNDKVERGLTDISYDLRNGYSLTDRRDCGENEWHASWSFDSVCEAIESVEGEITSGDLEVYWNNAALNEADTDGHGISFLDGRIQKVY